MEEEWLKNILKRSVALCGMISLSMIFIILGNISNVKADERFSLRLDKAGVWHYYTSDNKIDIEYTGMAENEYGWWYIENGTVDFEFTGMAENEYGWWYLTNGTVDWNYEGMAENKYGKWCISNGTVDFSYNGMICGPWDWVYITDGYVDTWYTGMAENEYGWWYITKGYLDRTYTGMAENKYGWWYMKNGAIDWLYEGLAENKYGKWILSGGTVDFSANEEYLDEDGTLYTVVNGYATVKKDEIKTGWVEEADGNLYYYNSDGELEQAVGMDVSSYQGNIDWDVVKATGEIKFAIIRIGFGDDDTSQDDRLAIRNMDECERVGIPYGVYLFSYAVSEEQAKSEASHLLRMIKGRNPMLGVYLDVENVTYDNGSGYYQNHGLDPYSEDGRRRLTDYTKIVLNALTDEGYRAGIYMNVNYYNNVLYMSELSGYRWLAAWGDYKECPIKGCKMWQYTSDGSVKGVPSERVDMDLWLNN